MVTNFEWQNGVLTGEMVSHIKDIIRRQIKDIIRRQFGANSCPVQAILLNLFKKIVINICLYYFTFRNQIKREIYYKYLKYGVKKSVFKWSSDWWNGVTYLTHNLKSTWLLLDSNSCPVQVILLNLLKKLL